MSKRLNPPAILPDSEYFRKTPAQMVVVSLGKNMKLSNLTTISALVVIGTVGFLAGRISSPDTQADATGDAPQNTRATRASGSAVAAGGSGARVLKDRVSTRSSLSATERLSRLESIVRGENPLDRNRALLAFIDQLGPGDFEEAVAHFRSLGITDNRLGEYSLLLSAWAKADPFSALAYAKENTNGRFATDTILTSWASLDPDAALYWAQSNHTGEGANPHLVGIIRGLAESDPKRATTLMTEMPRSRERGEALDAVLPYLLAQGNDATRAWISAITDDSLRNGAMMRAADRLASNDPAGTVSWLLENPGEATNRRMDDVYSTWARKDEQAAITSLARLPAGEVRSDALRGIVSSLAGQDPAKAISIMDRYGSDVNDNVVRNFIWHSFRNDPATAVGQIARIEDDGQRDRMYRYTLERWLERDATAAGTWMQSNPLPESVMQNLRGQVGQ
jgi:hypothetical protein